MSCLLTSDYAKGCDAPAGVAEFLVINTSEIDTCTYSNGALSALTLLSSKGAYRFAVDSEVTSYGEKPIGTKENGSYGYEQSFATKLHGNNDTLADALDKVSKGRVMIIFKLNDGTYEVLAHQYGCKLMAERVNEAKFDGFNGYNLTATHRQTEKMPTVSSVIVSALTVYTPA